MRVVPGGLLCVEGGDSLWVTQDQERSRRSCPRRGGLGRHPSFPWCLLPECSKLLGAWRFAVPGPGRDSAFGVASSAPAEESKKKACIDF